MRGWRRLKELHMQLRDPDGDGDAFAAGAAAQYLSPYLTALTLQQLTDRYPRRWILPPFAQRASELAVVGRTSRIR